MQSTAQVVRDAVFIQEQGISPEDEWDSDDAKALHAVLFDINEQPIGNARLMEITPLLLKVGRMAVLREARGKGHGAKLLQALLLEAKKRGAHEVCLSAQQTAKGFYVAHGFIALGNPFDEVGISHVHMHLRLA